MAATFSKFMLASVAGAALSVVGLVTGAHASPGSPIGHDPFLFNFDETGTAAYAVWNGTGYGPLIPVKPIVGAPFVEWQLPAPVVLGNVTINEPGMTGCNSATTCSDGLLFTSFNGNYFMTYVSLPDADSAADTGFPPGFFTTIFNGPAENANETYQYVAGTGDPNFTNFYNGVSNTVPEPAAWAMMLVGFAGVGFGYRRLKKVRAAIAA